MISFVFSSPRHHAEILLPVVRRLQDHGNSCHVVSIAELRGLETPTWDLGGAAVTRALPFPRPGRIPPPSTEPGDRQVVGWRGIAQLAAWKLVLGPRMKWLLRGSNCVVVPNDSAFPYLQLVRWLRASEVPVVLVQEGIRFKFPASHGNEYGKTGATRVCVWGEGSAEHFAAIGVPLRNLRITGNPRFDTFDATTWRSQRTTTLRELGLRASPLLFLSNPIETQGFCSEQAKLELFASFVRDARPVLAQRSIPIVVKLHSHEAPEAFLRVARRVGAEVTIASSSTPLFALLATARAAVVLASTVGLEALMFGIPLAVLQIPDHDFAFEYVQRDAAVGITVDAIAHGVRQLLDGTPPEASHFVERHLAHRGRAAEQIEGAILEATR